MCGTRGKMDGKKAEEESGPGADDSGGSCFPKPDSPVLPRIAFDRKFFFDLFVSRTTQQALHDDDFVERWIGGRLSSAKLESSVVPISAVDRWSLGPTGNIQHESGRFFSVTGLEVRHRTKNEEISWDQPIIEQPEIGILGILARKFVGVLHFCLQAKEEPGNINSVQLAPTVQATYSNYTQVHGGRLPLFIDLFLDPPHERLLFSRLQAEDGGRFLYKSNKNMVIEAGDGEATALPEEFIWLTLRQISGLMRRDNTINSCTRSVLSCLI